MANFDSKISREKYVKCVIGQTYFLAGCGYAFSALLIPKLSKDSVLSDEAVAWIASSGILLRSFVGGLSLYLIDSIGRRGTIRLKTLLIAVGWIISSVSSNTGVFCTGRIITSLGLGFIADNVAYISETCSKHHISKTVSLAASYTTAGIVFSNLLQYYFSWKTSSFVIAIVSIVVLFQSYTIPETKYWYMMKSRRREAIMTTLWFEKTKSVQTIQEELNIIERTILSSQDTNLLKILCDSSLIKPLSIYVIIIITRIGTGYLIFVHYAATFFQDLNTKYNADNLTIFISFFNFAFTALYPTLIKICKQRNILIVSSTIMILVIGVANAYQIMFHTSTQPFSWIPVTCLFVYMTINVAFFDPTISIVLSELFPKSTQQYISILHYAIEYKLSLVYVFAFPATVAKYGIESLLWFFFVNSLVCFVVTIHFTSVGNNPSKYECITLFENDQGNPKKVDQRELLQSMIEEDNSN
ncbi:facilitated trehalose transporter Tret1-like [Planococcus citri]|uniref:facilitated trehalose transporter Tret1-like n=1 Tax=Planococcus citri TaxID=170843 RepID=UPI0031F8B939